jgi:Fe-S-cluster-containing dehydrogenase component
MSVSRRELLKGAVAAGATAALAGEAEAREKIEPDPNAVGMLFDSTRCVGCRACQTACKAANKLPPDKVTSNGGVYDAPLDLNSTTKNIIKGIPTGDGQVYVKQQCMQCVDPSCVSACMFGAMHKAGEGKRHFAGEKKGSGIVIWDKYTCTGCRYCQIACAFNVPKFEWFDAFPRIVKCELCNQRADPARSGPYAIANPACCEACPREAVVYGWRKDLLDEAKRRLAAEPQRYNGHVYGEKEGGGTQVLYLAGAGVSFEQLGLPALAERSPAQFSESVSHAPYFHGVTPIVLYAGLSLLVKRNVREQHEAEKAAEDRKDTR